MKRYIYPLMFILLISSCVKDKIEIQDINGSISPQFGIPIAKATISAERVIEHYDEDGFVTSDGEGVLTLVYQDSLESISADEYLGLSNQNVQDTYLLGASTLSDLANFGSVSFSRDEIYNLDFSNDRLDSVRFETGELILNITSDGTIPLSGQMSILDPFTGEAGFDLNFSDATPPIAISITEDFTNLLLRLRSDDDYANGMRLAFNFELTDNGGTYPDEISVGFSLVDFSIASAGGYIAPRTLSLESQEARIGVFESDFEGDLRLEDPTLNLFFFNGFGIGVRPVINQIVGESNDGQTLVVPGSQISQLPVVSAAPAPGEVGLSQITIDNGTMTPSVTDFMSFEPKYVRGDVELEINPDNNVSNFISQGASLDVNFEVELPIYGSLADFNLRDSSEARFDDLVESIDDFQEIQQLDIRLFVRNALPIEAGVQLVFTDSLFNRIDSLFAEPTLVIGSAPVNLSAPVGSPDYGKVTGESSTQIDISIPRERIDPLKDVSQVIVYVFGNSTGNGENPIRLYPENFIEVNVAAKAIFNLEIE